LSLPGAVGLPLYVIAWILIPPAPVRWVEWRPVGGGSAAGPAGSVPGGPAEGGEVGETGAAATTASAEGAPRRPFDGDACCPRRERRGHWAGIILVLLGGFFLLDNLLPWFDLGRLWPLVLIVIGVALLVRGRRAD
jgi:hypothetical protein